MNRPAVTRPSLALLGCEPVRAALELATLGWRPPRPAPEGDGHPVVIFPGLGANGFAMTILRDHCRSLGYHALDWGRGFNTGPQGNLDEWLQQLAQDVGALLHGHARPASLIGWSLGGLYARELAKRMPGRVRQVISIGTSIYSRSDGVVPWRACRHAEHHPMESDIEVGGSHIGLGWNRRVLDTVRQRLA